MEAVWQLGSAEWFCPFAGSPVADGGIPQLQKSAKAGGIKGVEKGAGFLLLGVWGCPPNPKFRQDWGIKGVDYRGETFAISKVERI